MSTTTPCAGCGSQESYTAQCSIPGTDQKPIYVCAAQRGRHRGAIKLECFAKAFAEKCILCGKEHGHRLDNYSAVRSFSFACDACTSRSRLSSDTEMFIVGRDILRREELIRHLVHALGGQTTDYKTPWTVPSSSPSWICPADIGYVVSLTAERAEHLRKFLTSMRKEWDDSVRYAKEQGRSLLAGLASGDYTIKEFDDAVARQKKE